MKFLKKGDWGIKLLALALAIVLYHALKTESVRTPHANERISVQPR